MRFGISTASMYPQLTEDTFRLYGEWGIDCAEVFLNTLSELEPSYLRMLAGIARDSGVKVVSVHPFTCAFEPFMLFTGYDRRFRDALEWHRRYFDGMNQLGAEIFVFHGDRAQGTLPEEEYFARFAALRDLGREYGVTVAQENVERCRSRSLPFLLRMRDYLQGDLALVFDNKQAIRSGVDGEEFIRVLGREICHVHLSDHNQEKDCLPIGVGEMDTGKLLGLLEESGFQGAVVEELYRESYSSPQELREGYENLQKFGKKLA